MTKRDTGAFSHVASAAPSPRGVAATLRQPRHLAAVFVGGIAGTAARWAVTTWLPHTGLAWGTLLVDLSGSFLLGLLLELLLRRRADLTHHVGWRLLLGTGFCGAFTTYSSMSVEVARMLGDGRSSVPVGWAALTVVGGVLCASLGVWIGSVARRAQ